MIQTKNQIQKQVYYLLGFQVHVILKELTAHPGFALYLFLSTEAGEESIRGMQGISGRALKLSFLLSLHTVHVFKYS